MNEVAARVRVFGITTAEGKRGHPIELSPKTSELLALLVAAGPTGLTTEQLLEEVADGDTTTNAKSKLRVDLSRLRQRLGEKAIPSGRGRWRLDLPVKDVDFFALRGREGGELPASSADLLAMLDGSPFRDSGHSALIRAAIDQTAAARQVLLAEVIEYRSRLLTASVLEATRRLVGEDVFNDEFTRLVLDAHLVAGHTAAARQLLDEIETAYTEVVDYELPAFLATYRASVDELSVSGALYKPRSPRRMAGREVERRALRDWLVSSAPSVLVAGPAGSGKTRLVADFLESDDAQRHRPLMIVGRETAQSAFGSWRAALPVLAEAVRSFHEASAIDPLAAKSQLWERVRAVLLGDGATRLVVIDNLQFHDSLSLELIEFLQRTAGDEIRLLIIAKGAVVGDSWGSIEQTVTAAGGPQITLGGLSIHDLEQLAGELQPTSRLSARASFAAELLDVSGGLPEVARLLLAHAGPDLLSIDAPDADSGVERVVDALSPVEFGVAHAIATLGLGTSWSRLRQLTTLEEKDLLAAIDGLVSSSVVRLTHGSETTVDLSHVLMRHAIISQAPETERWRLNRDAAKMATNIHQRAEHEFLALPLIDGATSGESLLLSAATHVADGSYREAVNAFQRAKLRLGDRAIPTTALVDWAGALDRLGLDGGELRHEAVERSLATGDIDGAFDAAVSGLPEAEKYNGDEDRTQLLLSIDPERLSLNKRFAHAVTTGRQLAMLGRPDAAEPWLDRAVALAQSSSDKAEQARARWLAVCARTDPADRLNDALIYPEIESTSDLEHMRAADMMCAFDFVGSAETSAAVEELLKREPHPMVMWRHLLFASTRALAVGDISSASEFTNAAFQHGTRYGLREAGPAWLAQVFVTTWMQRGAGEVAEQLSLAQADMTGSLLADAARALALADSGADDEAFAQAEDLSERALQQFSYAGVAALVLSSRVVSHSADSPLGRRMYDALLPLKNSLAVFGGGFACLGPVELALGFLSVGSVRQDHIENTLKRVDSAPILGWQIAVRLELGRSFGDARLSTEGRSLAEGLGWSL